MKELSIEEKAKRYDEVIKKAKYYYDEGKTLEYANDIVSSIFPELRESEDERIRKYLIDVVNDYCKGSEHDGCIAWLEKQSNKNEIDYNEELKKCKANPLYFFDKYVKVKLKEQKPVNKVEPKFKVGDIIKHKDTGETYEVSKIEAIYADEIYYHLTNGGCVCENSDNFERVEQKYVTDLRTWKYIVDAVLTEKEGIGQYLDSPFTEEVAKKLQKRFGNIEQKSAWSEEDENLLELSVDNLTELKNRFGEEYGRTRDCIDWIESLKERCTWKPSDEQINALEYYIYSNSPTATITKGTIYGNLMVELLEQLKKLKGE